MNDQQLKILCNGIASIADIKNEPFFDVVDALIDMAILEEEDRPEIVKFMDSL